MPIIFWLLVVIVCIQAYFYFRQQSVRAKAPADHSHEAKLPIKKNVVKRPFKNKAGQGERESFQGKSGVIAVVLDDWGYNRLHCRFLTDMPESVGVAILPGLPFSKSVISCAAQAGMEPLLHLPLEPHNAREMYLKDYVLKTDTPSVDTQKSLARILDEMKGVVGVNNHTGSKGTEDESLVFLILSELKRRKLFFIDSVTSGKSVCGAVAAKLKVRIGRRDVFLDNRNERAEIERQFARAVRIARDTGSALIIGHDRVLTLQIVIEQMKKLKTQGIDFIPVSEYIRRYEYTRN